MRIISTRTMATTLALVILGIAPRPAGAQNAGNGYLFHAPEGRLTLRGGYSIPTANSDIFDFVTQNLTLKKSDFGSFNLGGEIAVSVSSRWDVSFDASYMRASAPSADRNYIDNNNQEIRQTTTFERVPLMVDARYYLTAPGRSIGRLAWIPTHLVPYVGAGGGAMYYKFSQDGDFVDYQTLNVFTPANGFVSDGWAPAVQGFGGFDVSITPMLAITTDVRYIYSRARPGTDFSDFNRIDLSGASASIGLTVRM